MCHSNETQPNQPTKRLGVHESNFDGNESTIQFGVPMILMPEMHLAIFECTTGFQKCTSKKKRPLDLQISWESRATLPFRHR
jgi:hypothetical protein